MYRKKTKVVSLVISLLCFFSFIGVEPLLAESAIAQCKNQETVESMGKRNPNNSKNKYIKGKQDLKNHINLQSLRAVKTYTMADLNTLSDEELIALIPTLQWHDITDLFQYNTEAYKFYNNKTRMSALIKEVELRGARYTESDDLGIPTFIEIIRAGYYLGFYYNELSYLNTIEEKNKCLPAIESLVNNTNFLLGTSVQDEIISSAGLFANAGFINVNIMNKFAEILKVYIDNIETFSKESEKGTSIFNILGGAQYSVNTYIRMSGIPIKNSEFYGNIDSYINQVMRMANIPSFTKDDAWVVNNGIYYTGEFAGYLTDPSLANRTLTNATEMYPYLGEQYFQAIEKIVDNFNSVDYNNNKIDYESSIDQGIEYHLPKEYTFDNGNMIIKTGNEVTIDKVQRLYWASKEVKAQFFRLYGKDKALEPGNPDETLEMVIYNTPDHYTMNRYLYGLSTDNGGMYIEPDGRFFTYERTEDESIYSLEELFRHEYTHYLQGRYLIPGMWGRGDIYMDERLTWYEEGGAELFAGSTRTEGIKMRQSMVSNIASESTGRFSLDRTLYSRYGSFEFYTYAFVFMSYLYENDLEAFNKLAKAINTSNVADYDAYRQELSTSARYNKEYDAYMQLLHEQYNSLITPLVSDDYLLNHEAKPVQEVYDKIAEVCKLNNLTTILNNSQFFNTFTLKGTYTGTTAINYEEDWKKMNSLIDGFLIELSKEPWTGYDTITAYFTNYRLDSNNNFVFDIAFSGICTSTEVSENISPVANINGVYEGIEANNILFNSNGSSDPDGTIVSYLWDFGDGSQSTEANPSHAYKTLGKYNVSLTVTDNLGLTNTVMSTVTVLAKPTELVDKEQEENDSFKTANGYLVSGKKISGAFDENDSLDYYYFEVKEPSVIDITVNNYDNIKLNWLLYSHKDTSRYIAYADLTDNTATGSYAAQPGKYYVSVYKTQGISSNYNLTVNITPDHSIVKTQVEIENNDEFDLANTILYDSPLRGNLDNEDYNDNFTFDVSEESKIKINLSGNSPNTVNWVVYNANDLNGYYSYPTKTEGIISGEFMAIPGKYFLRIYKVEGNRVPYEVNIEKVN